MIRIDLLYVRRSFINEWAHSREVKLARMVVIEIILTVLAADFISGFFHWVEDAYGDERWPITGRWITRPNTLHHHKPRYFTKHSWFYSSWLLLCIGTLVLVVAGLSGFLTWHVWLFVALGSNANQIHKWAHRSAIENGRLITWLQCVRLLQTPRHHAGHHSDPKNSHYCVLTNFLNPLLDAIRFWDFLETTIWIVFHLRRRIDTSINAAWKKTESSGHG